MPRPNPQRPNRPQPRSTRHRKLAQLGKWVGGLGLGCLLAWAIALGLTLRSAATQPIDGMLVLGGSIRREIYAAQLAQQRLAQQLPVIPIIISGGSMSPCVRLIFERERAAIDQVWLEECARSTFGNFYYSLPILQQQQVHRVKLITSGTHTGRALIMARLILGSHGIWVEPDLAIEQGRPGNHESLVKTVLDVGRSLGWAIGSQFYQPHCGAIVQLSTVDLAVWRSRKFICEAQGHVGFDPAQPTGQR